MRRTDLYKPYVRRGGRKNEKCESLRIAYRLAFYKLEGKPYYVLVQRGFPNHVVDVAASAEKLRRAPLLDWRYGFEFWARNMKQTAQGKDRIKDPPRKRKRRP